MNKNWHTGIATHQGTKKNRNEDSFLMRFMKDEKANEIAILVVADGMGGYQVGDAASRLAIDTIENWWEKRIERVLKKRNVMAQCIKEVKKVFQQVNKDIIATSNDSGKKMGTTLTVLFLYKGKYGVIHIGDSRVYQLRVWKQDVNYYFEHLLSELNEQTELLENEPELIQLTEDHSWVEQQVIQGKLSKEEARNHPKRNILLQCLGIEKEINPFTATGKYKANDLFVLCSDGFYSLFPDDEIKNMLLNLEKEYGNLQAVTDYLINFSNFSNAHDNITLMLTRHYYSGTNDATKNTSWLSLK